MLNSQNKILFSVDSNTLMKLKVKTNNLIVKNICKKKNWIVKIKIIEKMIKLIACFIFLTLCENLNAQLNKDNLAKYCI